MKAKRPRKENQVKYEDSVCATSKDLIKRTASTSDYSVSEVEDIYRHLIGNIQLMLAEGIELKLSGIGTFRRKRVKPRRFRSPLLNKDYLIFTSDSVSYTPDYSIRNVMRKARENAVDVKAYLHWLKNLTLIGEFDPIDFDRAKAYYFEKGVINESDLGDL